MRHVTMAVGGTVTLRAVRASTGSIAGGTTTQVTVTWPAAFSNTNYTAVVSVEEPTVGTNLRVLKIISRTTTNMVVRVENTDALNARTGTLHAIGIAD